MRFSDWGHKRAVLKLYRASRHIGSLIPEKARRPNLDHLPVCVIWGAGDPYLPVSYANTQRDYFPRAELHILPGLGHWPFIDDPQAVLDPLEAFLLQHYPADGKISQ
jgi:pimeloyl-ACP methyl ester carboxylesterase